MAAPASFLLPHTPATSGQLLSNKNWQAVPTADERLRPVLVFVAAIDEIALFGRGAGDFLEKFEVFEKVRRKYVTSVWAANCRISTPNCLITNTLYRFNIEC
jgi:hypothetical protein